VRDVDIAPVFIHNHWLILSFGNTDKQMETEIANGIDGEQLLARAADIETASRSLKAMSHPLRLKILCTLGNREVCVQGIVDNVGTSQSNISQHLAILRDKGILSSRKDANKVYYRVGDERTLRLIGMMQEVFCSSD
jgi:ArsR family transcriptional regulator